MIKTLFYLIQLAILVFAAVWLADNPGTVTLHWNEYTINVHTAVVAFTFIGTIVGAMLLYRLWRGVVSAPGLWKRYRREKSLLHGYDNITGGLVALAAGDIKNAEHYAKKARNSLPENAEGLILLLEAQSARLQGQEEIVIETYKKLATRKDTALLGVRGLMASSIEHGDEKAALTLARQALETAPKQTALLLECYRLETRTGAWDMAAATLKKIEKKKLKNKTEILSDRAAILTARADIEAAEENDTSSVKYLKKALRADPTFLPAAIRLAQYYTDHNKRSAAVKLIEKTWKIVPHPQLAHLWQVLAPANKPKDMGIRLRWVEKLSHINEHSVEAHLAIADTAMNDCLWGEARKALITAEDLRPTTRLYQLLAQLEEKEHHDPIRAREWLEKAPTANGDKIWYCSETGRTYSDWMPRANPHKNFNTITWGIPMVKISATNEAPRLLSI